MIHRTSGNLLDAQTEAIINTVNTVGVMGKGIALMFKERFPENFAAYSAACKAGRVRVGEMFVTPGVEIYLYEPTQKYQNVAKKQGVQKLTIARALVAEMVRRYEILGFDCSLLEIQKIAWFLERIINHLGFKNPLDLRFEPNRYGPYANRLEHLLNHLDGSYLNCDKRLSDATAEDTIRFNYDKRHQVETFFCGSEAKPYLKVIEATDQLIDGFQSPLGMEALATVDWLVYRAKVKPTLKAVKIGIKEWPTGRQHAERKEKLFSDQLLAISLERLATTNK